MGKTFTSQLIALDPRGAWTKVDLPFDASRAFGSKGRVSVKGTINGFAFRTSIFPNGDGTHHMMVNEAMKEGAGARAGKTVRITMERDFKPQEVEVPIDIVRALKKNKAAAAAFDRLAPSHRREHIRHIMEAKKPETRARRIEKMIEKLLT
jgi:hypothetical protein